VLLFFSVSESNVQVLKSCFNMFLLCFILQCHWLHLAEVTCLVYHVAWCINRQLSWHWTVTTCKCYWRELQLVTKAPSQHWHHCANYLTSLSTILVVPIPQVGLNHKGTKYRWFNSCRLSIALAAWSWSRCLGSQPASNINDTLGCRLPLLIIRETTTVM